MKKHACLILALLCYLGIHNGYLALFNNLQEPPKHVFPYRAELYPKIDRDTLNAGIPIRDPSSLAALLEDYLS